MGCDPMEDASVSRRVERAVDVSVPREDCVRRTNSSPNVEDEARLAPTVAIAKLRIRVHLARANLPRGRQRGPATRPARIMNSLAARVVAAALLLVGTARAFAPPSGGLLAPTPAPDPTLSATMIALPATPRVMRGASVCMREKKEAEKGGLVTGIRWIFVQGGVDVSV